MIPVNEPLLSGNEKNYLNECIDSGWISSEGPFVKKFEDAFSNYLDLKHGVSVSNGTAALETALYAIGISKGDEVIMPTFTIISCALSCLRLGAVPVLVDIEPETWTMDVNQIESKITSNTKAIMAVHIFGHPVDMDRIFEISKKYNLKILEDAAEAHGAQYYSESLSKWLKCGAMSDISTTSFYANKIITTGEGGMVVTNSEIYYKRAQSYRNLCFGIEERFNHTDIGYNFRMSNLQAAIGLAQMERIEELIALKIDKGKYYREKLTDLPGIKFQPIKPYARSVYWMYCIEINKDLGLTAKEVAARFKENKIGNRPFFKGLHAQEPLKQLGLFQGEEYPCSDNAYKYGLYLPSGMAITYDQIDAVVKVLKKIINDG